MSDSKDTPPSPTTLSALGDGQVSLDKTEPPLTEVLADPIVHTLLEGDGIALVALRSLIGETRKRLGATWRQRAERRKSEAQNGNDGGSVQTPVNGTPPRRRRDDVSTDPTS